MTLRLYRLKMYSRVSYRRLGFTGLKHHTRLKKKKFNNYYTHCMQFYWKYISERFQLLPQQHPNHGVCGQQSKFQEMSFFLRGNWAERWPVRNRGRDLSQNNCASVLSQRLPASVDHLTSWVSISCPCTLEIIYHMPCFQCRALECSSQENVKKFSMQQKQNTSAPHSYS